MKCPRCGKEIANGSRFCEFCGAKISSPKRIKVLWIVLVVLFGLSALGVGSFYVYDMYKQHEKEVAEARAAQEDAERQAKEAERQAEEALRQAKEAREKSKMDSIKAEEAKQRAQAIETEKIAKEAQARRNEEERRARLRAQGWVDLGLPSGTLWRDRNAEGGLYTYYQAVAKFGNQLPTKEQFAELKEYCSCYWTGNGFNVVGKNSETLFFPACGITTYGNERPHDVGNNGYYWSLTPYNSKGGDDHQYILRFESSYFAPTSDIDRRNSISVRLVR